MNVYQALTSAIYRSRSEYDRDPEEIWITQAQFDELIDGQRKAGYPITDEVAKMRLPDGAAFLFMGVPVKIGELV
jgi:hypothetical protein